MRNMTAGGEKSHRIRCRIRRAVFTAALAPAALLLPGAASARVVQAAQVVALGEPTPATRGLVGTPGDEGFVESTLGETYALLTLDAEGYRSAAANAVATLTTRFGSADPATWRDDRAMVRAEVQGLAIPPPIALQNRGTFELAVELGR